MTTETNSLDPAVLRAIAPELAGVVESMRLVSDDCESDAAALDGQPFSGKTMGENFGGVYAMVQAAANGIGILAVDLNRQIAELTELLTELRDDHHELAVTFRRHQAKALLRDVDDASEPTRFVYDDENGGEQIGYYSHTIEDTVFYTDFTGKTRVAPVDCVTLRP